MSHQRLEGEMSTEFGGRYRLTREVGAGGMGRVFQALDTRTGRTVAAKILIAGSAVDPQALIRFAHEGAILATLKHPNIVQVFGTHLEEDAASIIMEFLEGRSLAQILGTERLSLGRTQKLMLQTASALAFAHQRGIVHRDVKPDNIMVVAEDQVKVTDFGIARIVQEGNTFSTMTATGQTVGTPLYMSPEQIETGKVDGRSDIYSFGCVLYQMVTGRPPFQGGDPLTVAFQHVHKAPEPPGSINASLPDTWDTLILRCLAKNPDRRYQTVDALETALRVLEVRPTAMRQERGEELQASRVELELRARDGAARTMMEGAKTKELRGDLRGALRDYRMALTLVSWGPLAIELEATVEGVSARITASAVPTDLVAEVAPVRPPLAPQQNRVVSAPPSITSESPWSDLGEPSTKDSPLSRRSGSALQQDRRVQVLGALGTVLVVATVVFFVVRGSQGPKALQTAARFTSWGTLGSGPGQFNQPAGMALDRSGNIYVADWGNKRIVKLSPSGQYLMSWGGYGSVAGQFKDPDGVALDSSGDIYVVDSGSSQIVKLSPSGQYLTSWGTYGSGLGEFDPMGVALDSSSNIYVADSGNNRIVKISP